MYASRPRAQRFQFVACLGDLDPARGDDLLASVLQALAT